MYMNINPNTVDGVAIAHLSREAKQAIYLMMASNDVELHFLASLITTETDYQRLKEIVG